MADQPAKRFVAPEMTTDVESPEGSLLVLAVVKQAVIDLDNPAEREGAIDFLTEGLWEEPSEGLDYRAMCPRFFVHEAEARARIEQIIAGEIEGCSVIVDSDGVISYDGVRAMLLSESEGQNVAPQREITP